MSTDWRDNFSKSIEVFKEHGCGNQRYLSMSDYIEDCQCGCLTRLVSAVNTSWINNWPDRPKGWRGQDEVWGNPEMIHYAQVAADNLLKFWNARGDHSYLLEMS